MTVSSNTPRADYDCNGVTTNFTVPFQFFLTNEIKVLKTDTTVTPNVVTTLALTTDYVVTGGAGSTGAITTVSTFPTGIKLSILPNLPLTQLTHYIPGDPFPAASHEAALDRLDLQDQQLSEQMSRALILPPTTVGVDTTMPIPVANTALGWNSTATGLATLASFNTAAYVGTPLMDGVGQAGDGSAYAAGTHRHPTDTSRAPTASPTFTGTATFVNQTTTGTVTVTGATITGLNASSVNFTQTGTGAITSNLDAKAKQVKSVLEYGAVGDGVTDDSVNIQKAIDANKGGRINFPQGYNFLCAGILLDGSTYNSTILHIDGTVTMKASGGGTNFQSTVWGCIIGHSVDGLAIEGPGIINGNRANQPNNTGEHCIVIAGCSNWSVRNLRISEIRGDGIYIGQATLSSSSTDSSNGFIGNLIGANTADDGRNLVSVVSSKGLVVNGLFSYQIGGTVNSVVQPGGIDLEPNQGYQTISDVILSGINVTTAGTAGVQIAGKSISGTDANMDWNVTHVVIEGFTFKGTAAAATSGAPTFTRCGDLAVRGQSFRANAGNGVAFDYVNRLRGDITSSGATVGIIMGSAGFVYDFDLQILVPNFTAQGMQAVGVNRGRFRGRIYGATSATNTFCIRTRSLSRGITQTGVIYAVDCPYDASLNPAIRAFRNEPADTVTYGTGTRVESCDWTGYTSFSVQCDANIPSVAVQGRNYNASMPGSGNWAADDFVQNSAFAVADSNGRQLQGWTRITSGTGAVLNTDWVAVYTAVQSSPGASSNTTSAAPTGTASTTAVMMGIAGSITPTSTGRVTFTISGQMANNTVNDGATVQLRTGTGTAPTNGAALTGTQRGVSQTHTSLVAADTAGFSITVTVTGLTLGTAVWIDAALAAVTGGTASITGVTINAVES